MLRRIELPADLDAITTVGDEADPAAGGMDRDAVERIWADTVSWYRSGVHPAIQVCVRREGAVVLDRAIGHARGNGPRDNEDAEREPATPGTPFTIYSGAKAITAFVVHLLHERGALDIERPVCSYIPGYERHGKEGITVAHVLAHRAGVPNLPRDALDLDSFGDREHMVEILCDAKPFSKPGRYLAYHAVSGGFILGEVVHRVTGRSIRDVLAAEILAPLGFRWMNFGVEASDVPRVAHNHVTGPPVLPPLSNLLTRALGSSHDELVRLTNDERFLTGVVPAANTVTTANELSRFYELMRRGGELDGVRVMRPQTIRHALTEQSHLEFDLSLGFPTRFSYGLMLGAARISLYGGDTQHAFGHLGYTTCSRGPTRSGEAQSANHTPTASRRCTPSSDRFYGLAQRITNEAPKAR